LSHFLYTLTSSLHTFFRFISYRSPEFVIVLRSALDVAGFTGTKLVCGDDAHHFSCSSTAATNSTLRNAIVALGVHGPDALDPIALSTGLALWGTEVHAPDPGGVDLVNVFLSLYSTFDVTSFLLWNLVSSYNPGLFSPDWGVYRAWWPWCNHYELDGRAWVFAHFTQSTSPGWKFVNKENGGSGNLINGGSWNILVDKPTQGLTMIISKPNIQGVIGEIAMFNLSHNNEYPLPTVLYAMKSIVISGSDFGRNLSDYFVIQEQVPILNGILVLTLQPGDLWTLSTVPMKKGISSNIPPPASLFPNTWFDDFNNCPIAQEADYFTDQTGVFECVNDTISNRGVIMRQVVPTHPIAWRPDEQRPFTIFTSDINWVSMDVSIDIRLSVSSDIVTIGVRANPNCCGRVITGEDFMPGAWVAIDQKSWTLYNAIANITTQQGILTSGILTSSPTLGVWHTLRFIVTSTNLASFFYDGVILFQEFNVTGLVPANGFVGFGTGDWGQSVEYDRFNVTGRIEEE
jgi:hypothetical protein